MDARTPLRLLVFTPSLKTIEGKVVAREFYDFGTDAITPDEYLIAVDDGRGDVFPFYRLDRERFDRVRLGERVRLMVRANHGYVFKLETLT